MDEPRYDDDRPGHGRAYRGRKKPTNSRSSARPSPVDQRDQGHGQNGSDCAAFPRHRAAWQHRLAELATIRLPAADTESCGCSEVQILDFKPLEHDDVTSPAPTAHAWFDAHGAVRRLVADLAAVHRSTVYGNRIDTSVKYRLTRYRSMPGHAGCSAVRLGASASLASHEQPPWSAPADQAYNMAARGTSLDSVPATSELQHVCARITAPRRRRSSPRQRQPPDRSRRVEGCRSRPAECWPA